MKATRLLPLLVTMSLWAQPTSLQVIHGSVQLRGQETKELTISIADAKAILHWGDFSISADELVRFIQPSAHAAVLNRVVGGSASALLGKLEANGQVFLINPNGVVVGKNAVIDAGAFTASTLDIHNRVFLDDGPLVFCGESQAAIQQLGSITAREGNITLVAAHIDQRGSLKAPNGDVSVLGFPEVILKPQGGFSVKTELTAGLADEIEENGLYSLAFTHPKDAIPSRIDCSGTVQAQNISVLSEQIIVAPEAFLDVSTPTGGGQILLGGDYKGNNPEIPNAAYLHVQSGAKIRADALEQGNGGRVILWADHCNGFEGSITARGGPEGGDGGFVEISSKGLLLPSGPVDTLAPQGKAGTLLLDPCQVTISTAAQTAGITPPPPGVGGAVSYAFAALATGNITTVGVTSLIAYLNGGNVIIDAGASGDPLGVGTIDINGSVTWTAATTLTLIAPVAIRMMPAGAVNYLIRNTNATIPAGTDTIVLRAPIVRIGSETSVGGTAAVRATSGGIRIEALNSLELYGEAGASNGTVIMTEGSGPMTIICGDRTLGIRGDLFLRGGTGTNAEAAICAVGTPTTNTINIDVTGDITLQASLIRAEIKHRQSFDITPGIPTVGSGSTTIVCDGDVNLFSGATSSPATGRAAITTDNTDPLVLNPDLTLTLGGNLRILGGQPTGGSANCQAALTTAVNGDITINTPGDVFLRGGTGGVNGFASATIATTVTSGAGNLSVSAQDITLIGGTGSPTTQGRFAEINGRTPGGIGTSAVDVAATGELTLIGGNGSATGAAGFSALISTNDTAGNNDIHISAAGGVTLLGGIRSTATSFANAEISTIGNGNILIDNTPFVTPFVSIYGGPASALANAPTEARISTVDGNITLTVPTILLEGGVEDATAAAPEAVIRVTGSNPHTITLNTTDLTVRGSPATGAPFSQAAITIVDGLIDINASGNVAVEAGNSPSASAIIGAPAVPEDTAVNLDASFLTLQGSLAATGTDSIAAITSFNGDIDLDIVNDAALTGGMATTSTAQISTGSAGLGGAGNVTGDIGGTLAITGGSLGNAFIETLVTGNVDFDSIGSVNILGGTGASVTGFIGTMTGNIDMNVVGNMSLVGGTAALAHAQVLTITMGNITLDRIGGSLTLQGGTGAGALASIETDPGSINFIVNGNTLLTGGSGGGAQITTVTDGSITGTCNNGLTIAGGTAATSFATISAQIDGNILLTVLPDAVIRGGTALGAAATVETNTGNTTLRVSRDLAIVSQTDEGAVRSGVDVNVEAGRNLCALGLGTFASITGAANAGSTGIVDIIAGDNICLNDNSFFSRTSNAAGDLTARAGNDFRMTGFSRVFNDSPGTTSLVCDNDFPTPPGIGLGEFFLGPDAFVDSGPGPLRVYTAIPQQNTFLGLLNGFNPSDFGVSAGLFVDTQYEQWCTYFPSNFNGFEFTIFYKPCFNPIATAGNLVVSEMLLGLEWSEDYTDLWKFLILYDKEAKIDDTSSYTILPDEYYWLMRRRLHLLQQPLVNRYFP